MAWVFGAWGAIVERCTLLVFIISLAVFGYAGYGLRLAKLYGTDDFVFAPIVSKLNHFAGLIYHHYINMTGQPKHGRYVHGE